MKHAKRTSLWPKKWLRAFWGAALATGVVSSTAWTQEEKLAQPAEVKKADDAKKAVEDPKKATEAPASTAATPRRIGYEAGAFRFARMPVDAGERN